MCGICGAFNLELHPLGSPDLTRLMSSRIEHRGPDSYGRFSRSGLALDIRRLSIIDIETGDQPLSNESGEVTLVVNGEIYNYRELRKELVSRGHNFKTNSDGEVITHLYEEKGANCLAELNERVEGDHCCHSRTNCFRFVRETSIGDPCRGKSPAVAYGRSRLETRGSKWSPPQRTHK